jgi:hypothetical protein
VYKSITSQEAAILYSLPCEFKIAFSILKKISAEKRVRKMSVK